MSLLRSRNPAISLQPHILRIEDGMAVLAAFQPSLDAPSSERLNRKAVQKSSSGNPNIATAVTRA